MKKKNECFCIRIKSIEHSWERSWHNLKTESGYVAVKVSVTRVRK